MFHNVQSFASDDQPSFEREEMSKKNSACKIATMTSKVSITSYNARE